MNIQEFMAGYRAAWEGRDPAMFASLFHEDGKYNNTPFQVRAGKAALAKREHVLCQVDPHGSNLFHDSPPAI